ncbi:MAG: SurA N-terminal domain-containing protein [Desulfobacterales bacterium]|nr:SurA N-terminal domain-containing protein [Desulfobacterales bacterium]
MEYRIFKKIYILILILSVSLFFSSCSSHDSEIDEKVYLIKVGSSEVSIIDFENAMEAAKMAYPYNIAHDPQFLRELRLRLINQLSEELIVMERAKELGIVISDEELETLIADFKKDYPEDVFDEMLIESAISYAQWKEKFSRRILIEKTVTADLESSIEISHEEISAYYKEHYEGNETVTQAEKESQVFKRTLIRRLRRDKTELAYKPWIESLKENYNVEVNRDQLEEMGTES